MYPSKAVLGTTLCHTEICTKPRRHRSCWRVTGITPDTTASHYDRAAGSQTPQGQDGEPGGVTIACAGEVVVVVGSRHLDTSQLWSSSCGRNGRGWSSPPIGRCGPPCWGDGGRSRQPHPRPPPSNPPPTVRGMEGGQGGARRGGTPRGDSRPPPRPLPSRFGRAGEGAMKRK